MAFKDQYLSQVQLLVRILPCLTSEPCFALKGGTAINLFVKDMPRLSVDIDLTYLPIGGRKRSLKDIEKALHRIGRSIGSAIPGVRIKEHAPPGHASITKLIISSPEHSTIKIEANPIWRGSVYPPLSRRVCEAVEENFGFAETQLLSHADLYAGKVIAALDRQHPRDLFDVHHLLASDGIDDALHTAILVYLISHPHSPHSLLCPEFLDIRHSFEHGFSGMTREAVSLTTLLEARENLVNEIRSRLSNTDKTFLLSFYLRKPDWSLLGADNIENIRSLPAVRWRENNLDKAGEETRKALTKKLEQCLQ